MRVLVCGSLFACGPSSDSPRSSPQTSLSGVGQGVSVSLVYRRSSGIAEMSVIFDGRLDQLVCEPEPAVLLDRGWRHLDGGGWLEADAWFIAGLEPGVRANCEFARATGEVGHLRLTIPLGLPEVLCTSGRCTAELSAEEMALEFSGSSGVSVFASVES